WALRGWSGHHHFIFEQALYPHTYARSLPGLVALAGRCLQLLPSVLGLPVIIAIVAGPIFGASLRGLGVRVLACGLYLASFVAVIGYVFPLFLLPLLGLALLLAAQGMAAASQRMSGSSAARFFTAAVIALS